MSEKETTPPVFEGVGTELVKLPSKGKLYPTDHPLHDKETAEIHYMTANEEDILTSPALIKRGLVFDTLLRSCLVDKTIDPETLLVCDRNAIIIALRASGYGENYTVPLLCADPDCGRKFEYTFNLNKLPIKFINTEDIETPFTNRFTFKLPMSKKTIVFKMLTAQDEKEIAEEEEKLKEAVGGILIERGVTTRLKKGIVSIDGVEDRTLISTFTSKMLSGDSHALRKRINEVRPGVRLEQEATCSSCGTTSTFVVPLTPEFFWPSF